MGKNVKIYSDFKFAERFRTLMGKQNLTLEDIAKLTGNAVSTASTWRRGRKPKRDSVIKKLSSAFGVSPEYLLHGDNIFIFSNSNEEYMSQKKRIIRRMDELMDNAAKSDGGLEKLAAAIEKFNPPV